MKDFQNISFLKGVYSDKNLIKFRGDFLKKYSIRDYSMRDLIILMLPVNIENKNILDVGCGSCSFIKKMYANYPNNCYTAFDIVENVDCKKIEYVDYRIESNGDFSRINKKFDFIFCMHMLYHIHDFDLFFNQIKNILNEKFKIVITSKSKKTFPKMEFIFKEIIKTIGLENNFKIGDFRDEDRFCLENGRQILERYFDKKFYLLKERIVETSIRVSDKRDLLKYIMSTQRYNIKNYVKDQKIIKKYQNLWKDKLSEDIYEDKYVEVIYLIEKI